MKVYTLNKEIDYSEYTYPEDVKKIMDYLEKHGEIHVSVDTIVNLYYTFSDDEYCAGWIGVDEDTLRHFAEWLDECNL